MMVAWPSPAGSQRPAMVDADGGACCLDARVNQGGSYRRDNNIAHRFAAETSVKAQ